MLELHLSRRKEIRMSAFATASDPFFRTDGLSSQYRGDNESDVCKCQIGHKKDPFVLLLYSSRNTVSPSFSRASGRKP